MNEQVDGNIGRPVHVTWLGAECLLDGFEPPVTGEQPVVAPESGVFRGRASIPGQPYKPLDFAIFVNGQLPTPELGSASEPEPLRPPTPAEKIVHLLLAEYGAGYTANIRPSGKEYYFADTRIPDAVLEDVVGEETPEADQKADMTRQMIEAELDMQLSELDILESDLIDALSEPVRFQWLPRASRPTTRIDEIKQEYESFSRYFRDQGKAKGLDSDQLEVTPADFIAMRRQLIIGKLAADTFITETGKSGDLIIEGNLRREYFNDRRPHFKRIADNSRTMAFTMSYPDVGVFFVKLHKSTARNIEENFERIETIVLLNHDQATTFYDLLTETSNLLNVRQYA